MICRVWCDLTRFHVWTVYQYGSEWFMYCPRCGRASNNYTKPHLNLHEPTQREIEIKAWFDSRQR